MEKLQIMREAVNFQMKIFEFGKDSEEVSVSQINDLLLSKRGDLSANSIYLCVSTEGIPIRDEITGLPSVVTTKKFDKDFAVVVDMSKLSNIDILDNFITGLNSGQVSSKKPNKLALIMANAKEGQDTTGFDKQLVVSTLQKAVDSFLIGA